MYNYFNKIFYIRLIIILFSLLFSSCVYFNTFYNTKYSFNQAIDIIDSNSSVNYKEKLEISNTAKKLLYESISSGNIVINKYPDSKYVDDAIYYIGRSYFSLGEFYKSEKYFNQLINNHSDSEYYDEGKLWLEYTHLKLNLLDSVIKNISNIENDFESKKSQIDEKIFSLLYNLKADLFIELKEYDKAFIEFEKSLDFIKSKSKKTMIYSKLAYICESENKFNQAIEYLTKIEIISNNKEIKIEAFRKRLNIMDKMRTYNDMIFEIQEKLSLSDFQTTNLYDEFNLKLAISYMKIKNFSEAKNLFNNIIESTNKKNIKAEAYYWLGYIFLIDGFDLEFAIEYFNLVTETSRSSDFSKKVKTYIKDIESYNSLLEEYNFLLNNDHSNLIDNNDNQESDYIIQTSMDLLVNEDYSDSLLFIIAEKLYFDFNQIELSINKYEELIDIYPNSSYATRSKKIIQQLRNNSWYIEDKVDSLEVMRDLAWDKFNINKIEGIKFFHRIIKKYDDFYSYYSLGMIYEHDFPSPDSLIYYYTNALDKSNNEDLNQLLNNKLLLLKESINDTINSLNQNINHIKGVNFILTDFNLDSALFYIKSDELNSIITNYQKLSSDLDLSILKDSLLSPSWEHKKYNKTEIDSILFTLANISFWFFKQEELSKRYIDVINKQSNYYALSEHALHRIDSSSVKIDSLEAATISEYKNKSNKYIDQYHYDNFLEKRYKDDLIIYHNLLNYFPENEDDEVIDTLSSQNKENMDNQKLPNPNINTNILPNIDIKKNFND